MRVLFFTLILLAQSWALAATSQGLLEDLRVLKAREAKRFFYLKKAILNAGAENLDELRNQFLEHKRRTDLLDRLIFYTDTHYRSGDAKAFLEKACLKLAEREVQNPDLVGQGFWEFYRNTAKVLKETKDSDLTATAILESYMSYASVLNPKSPDDFIKPRDYTNGEVFESARSVSPEDVGDLVDQVMAQKTVQESNTELSQPQLKPVFISEQSISKETETPQ